MWLFCVPKKIPSPQVAYLSIHHLVIKQNVTNLRMVMRLKEFCRCGMGMLMLQLWWGMCVETV
jgi:hypothetical protein